MKKREEKGRKERKEEEMASLYEGKAGSMSFSILWREIAVQISGEE